VLGFEDPFNAESDVGDFSVVSAGDLDGDDRVDVVAGHSNGIEFFKSNGTHLERQLGNSNPFSGLSGMGSGRIAASLSDIDGDGRLDAFVGFQNGTVLFLKNMGPTANPLLQLVTCPENPFCGITFGREALASFVDLDGDGDNDMVVGVQDGSILTFRNDGSATQPRFERVELSPFQSSVEEQILVTRLSFVDIDGDGWVDCFIGASTGRIRHYRNTGKAGSPKFALLSGSADPFDGTSVVQGTSSSFISKPTLVDLDGDEKLDVVVGTENGRVFTLANIGNLFSPKFSLLSPQDNPFENVQKDIDATLVSSTSSYPHLFFADLDADGETDLLIDAKNGTRPTAVLFYRNNGTSWNLVGNESPFVNLTTLAPFFPAIVGGDLDDDGDIDFLTGGGATTVQTFLNSGTANFPIFTGAAMSGDAFDLLGDTAVNDYVSCIVDIDVYGDLDVVIGAQDGTIGVLLNERSKSFPLFIELENIENPFIFFDPGLYSSIAMADLDKDGDPDAVVGNIDGDLFFLKNTARECQTACFDRGTCGEGTAASTQAVRLAGSFQGFDEEEALSAGIGVCACRTRFAGEWCEQCDAEFYGFGCMDRCPQFSRTNLSRGELALPLAPTIENCLCDPSFVQVTSLSESFTCECPVGFGFSAELLVCQRCDLGFFSETVGLDGCTSCETVLGKGSTTTITAASSAESCICEPQFEQRNDECVCPDGSVFNNLTSVCDRIIAKSRSEVIYAAGGTSLIAAFLALAAFLFLNRDHIRRRGPILLPWGCSYYFFISYKHDGGKELAHSLAESLRLTHGFKIWFDENQNEVTTPTMAAGVRASAVYVLVLSNGVLDSLPVLKELSAAIEADRPIMLVHGPGFKFNAIPQAIPPALASSLTVLFEGQHSIESIESSSSTVVQKLLQQFNLRSRYKLSYLQKKIAREYQRIGGPLVTHQP